MTKPLTNFAASVRARLLDVTKRQGGNFQFTLQRYAAERFLYRLGVSPHRERFILKGAMLFIHWAPLIHRPTKDLDLAGYWENDAASLEAAFRDMCSIACPTDGLEFDLATLTIEPIRDGAEYHGFRIRLNALLAGAVIPFQVDVGFGDAIIPEPSEIVYPVLLDAEPPRIRAYPREASIAEKLHAMVSHADVNTRYKDFYDIYLLSSRFSFEGATLAESISATFSRRKAAMLSAWPVALTPGFYADASRAEQWRRYLSRSNLTDAPPDFGAVGERVIGFLQPAVLAVSTGEAFRPSWAAGGPWQ